MSPVLEDRLRAYYAAETADLPHRGPGINAQGEVSLTSIEPRGRRSRRLVLLAAAGVAVLLIGGLVLLAGRSPERVPATQPDSPAPISTRSETTAGIPATTTLAPAATLPLTADVSSVVPPTVVADGPTDWYRLAPDLDVAWYSPNDGSSFVCLRTPVVAQQCDLDEVGGGGDRYIETSGDQLLVVLFNGLQNQGTAFMIELDDGSTTTAPIQIDPEIGWGIARFEIAEGRTLVGIGMST